MSRGLPCNFNISNGRFVLTDGVEKSRDNIWFFCIFDKFRVYCSDFGANFVYLVQKPVSYLVMNRTILLGNISKNMQKYVPNVKVNDIDIGYTSKDRKNYALKIEYETVLENKEKIQDVTFV